MNDSWTEIKIKIDVKDVETASNIAVMSVPYGFFVEDYSDLEQGAREIAHIDLIDEELLKKDRDTAIIHIYIEPSERPDEAANYLKSRFEDEGIGYEIIFDEISEDDWANNWKAFFKPTKIGEKLLILPEWESAKDEGRIVLKIDPGAAFGTGTHATTRLCLEAVEGVVNNGDSVLDVGCGSGILSIAALLLGAKNAVAVDIDELAVKTARANSHKNGFDEPRFTAICGDLAEKVQGKFDLVVANIVADVIIRLCDNVADYMSDGALFITSGIIDSRGDEVEAQLINHGFEIMKRLERGGWVAFVSRIKRG